MNDTMRCSLALLIALFLLTVPLGGQKRENAATPAKDIDIRVRDSPLCVASPACLGRLRSACGKNQPEQNMDARGAAVHRTFLHQQGRNVLAWHGKPMKFDWVRPV